MLNYEENNDNVKKMLKNLNVEKNLCHAFSKNYLESVHAQLTYITQKPPLKTTAALESNALSSTDILPKPPFISV